MESDSDVAEVSSTKCLRKQHLKLTPSTPVTPGPAEDVKESDRDAFLNLINKDTILKAFFLQDSCFRICDKYLLAMVFVYFKRANLNSQYEFNRENFFLALCLALSIEEECDDDRWEILPWALGRHWRQQLKFFAQKKLNLWHRMDFR